MTLAAITGITEVNPNVRQAEYMFEMQPTQLAGQLGLAGNKRSMQGRALFRKYDDGWRMEQNARQ
jgi:hypothetical protein